jgi:hypothetical protein
MIDAMERKETFNEIGSELINHPLFWVLVFLVINFFIKTEEHIACYMAEPPEQVNVVRMHLSTGEKFYLLAQRAMNENITKEKDIQKVVHQIYALNNINRADFYHSGWYYVPVDNDKFLEIYKNNRQKKRKQMGEEYPAHPDMPRSYLEYKKGCFFTQ